ncbi:MULTISPECIES: flavodoxin family protein [Sphingobium]|jgi:NAD(P)H dehydrogenase (quinone)|uniref:NADPH-dependent FMN reductase n=1 Tax=Sphingobium yanoikuyae TaxID=13690 RepID=A0A177K2V5_SPHYA|nr:MULTISPECIES: flavodoxin family protein [Sphingobium]MBR2268554.1 flavodoxin family protein [Sphingobium sp.]OAH46901.1 NADPH-dependent FMN reductase [Sphingobium yanoikuyae]PZU66462.1 MAG: flavodoxin family protein [Sphingobium sp.]
MSKIAIVYHSGFGHTDVLARDVAQGVTDSGGVADLLRIDGLQADFGEFFDRIADVDAIIFGSPTYMGTVSAPMKAFMDASAKVYFTKQWKDKLGAAFTVSGSPSGDKLNTLTSLAIFAAQHGMLWIGTGQNPGNNDDESAATEVENRLGSFIGAMAQAANDSPDVTPKAGDRATARSLGRRVAQAAARWRAGIDHRADALPA